MWILPALHASVVSLLGPDYQVTTDVPADKSAWLAIPVFQQAKQQQITIEACANAVATKLHVLPDIIVEVAGGFVNIRPVGERLAAVLEEAARVEYGQSVIGDGKTIVVEFSSPNIAKPMGIGHLRSTIIGDSLRRIYTVLGYNVVSLNHLGDWGTQFGNLLVAYETEYGDLNVRPNITIQELLTLYVGFHANLEKNPELKEQGQAMFRRLEDGDSTVRALWEAFVELSLAEFIQMYTRLGVRFTDARSGESQYEPYLQPLISLAKEHGVAKVSEGALVVPIPTETVPLMLEKRDGATTYALRDLAAIQHRVNNYHPEEILYVVANEQALHFRQVFAAARVLDIVPKETQLTHVKFGLVRTAEGKMSTRKGTLIALNDLLNEAVSRAGVMILEKNPNLKEQDRVGIAERLGVGAIKYLDLSHDRNHDIVFDWERALSLKGDSAPYLQYSYVRATNIINKAGVIPPSISRDMLEVEQQAAFIRAIARYPIVLEQAAKDYAPHLIAQYLNDLAARFHAFYEHYPVLAASEGQRAVRLEVVAAFKSVLAKGLGVLGIETVDVM